jgi:hypothetical protein
MESLTEELPRGDRDHRGGILCDRQRSARDVPPTCATWASLLERRRMATDSSGEETFARLAKMRADGTALQKRGVRMMMCGRFTIRVPMNLILKHFAIGHSDLQLALRYNVAPTQQIPVVRQVDAHRELTTMRWGLVPSWADDVKIGYKLINARSEDAAKKPSFRSAMKRQRCLIPADGFFEWEKIGKEKQPHWFRRADGEPFAFAGLWEHWAKADPEIESCTILNHAAERTRRPVPRSHAGYLVARRLRCVARSTEPRRDDAAVSARTVSGK